VKKSHSITNKIQPLQHAEVNGVQKRSSSETHLSRAGTHTNFQTQSTSAVRLRSGSKWRNRRLSHLCGQCLHSKSLSKRNVFLEKELSEKIEKGEEPKKRPNKKIKKPFQTFKEVCK
jgi:hypothetical protein